MSSSLRTILLSSTLSLTLGCSFFSIDDPGIHDAKKSSSMGAAAGTGGAAAGTTGTGGSTGAAPGAGGDMPSGGMPATGGTAAGGTAGGDTAGSGTMAGAGGSAGGAGGDAALGGMGGLPLAGGAGMATAGAPGAGMGGSGATGCAALNPGSQPFGGHCYLLVTSASDFNTAKASCAAMNAHLVTISNGDPESMDTFDAEDQFVYGLAGGQDVWLGLTDGKSDTDSPDGTFYTWITGEPSPPDAWGTAYGWADGEPNNYAKTCASGNGSCWEHCGFMVKDAGDKWNDDLCMSQKQYVCEWDMGGS